MDNETLITKATEIEFSLLNLTNKDKDGISSPNSSVFFRTNFSQNSSIKKTFIANIKEKTTIQSIKHVFLKGITELNNERSIFILSGHRKELNYIESMVSILSLHNETLNIWTNLIPFFLVIYFTFEIYTTPQPSLTQSQLFHYQFVFLALNFALMTAFLASAFYHTFNHHVKKTVRKRFVKLDYIGIYLIGMGCSLPGIYFGFECYPFERTIYLLLNLINGVIGMGLASTERFRLDNVFRISSISGAASFGLIFIAHLWWIIPIEEFSVFSTGVFFYFFFMLIGITAYSTQIPERFSPGTFDICGHSHQWWHTFATFGIFILYSYWIHYFWWKVQNNYCFA